jgi:hypothetical protein
MAPYADERRALETRAGAGCFRPRCPSDRCEPIAELTEQEFVDALAMDLKAAGLT